MRRQLTTSRRLWAALTVAMVALVSGLLCAQAQGQGATVRPVPPRESPISGGPPFTVSVVVENVSNLGAFQFEMTFDPRILRLVEIKEGPFLGSSNRQVQCLSPQKAEGSVSLACVTLGATPAGPDGSGELATITFDPVAEGSSPLRIQRLILTDPPAQLLPANALDASVTVVSELGQGGTAWTLWGPLLGGLVVLVAMAVAFGWWARRRARAH